MRWCSRWPCSPIAAHMLTDAAAIALALVAIRLARRPAKGALTYGCKRAEILSAQFNGATLLVLALLIIYEGIRRLIEPPACRATAVLVVALVGVVVNLVATWTLSKANRQTMNVEGAFQQILTDLAAFVFTAIAGVVILTTGFHRADGIASLVIAAIMLRAGYGRCAIPGGSSSKRRQGGLTPTRSAAPSSSNPMSPRSTTFTSGRSAPGFPRCRPTCS